MFIAIEGIDGAGTTTQSKILHDKLLSENFKSFWTCEPSTGPIGSMIRQFLSGRIGTSSLTTDVMSNKTLACLFAADRYDHLQCTILPMLKTSNVITDRYHLSTLAYQTTNSVELAWAEHLHDFVKLPDITFFLNISASVAFERIYKNRSTFDMHEKQELLIDIAARYSKIVNNEISLSEHIVVIDGTKPIREIADFIWNYTTQYLKY